MSCGCFWNNCDQTLEELPLDSEVSSRQLHFSIDATGLPPPPSAKGAFNSTTLHGLSHSDYTGMTAQSPKAAFMGSIRSSKSRRASSDPCMDSHGFASSNNGDLSVAMSSGERYPTIDKS